jgi:nicotinamidase-related amidase
MSSAQATPDSGLSAAMIALNPSTTALVLIDLQNGILGRTLIPVSADQLLDRGKALARRFRTARAPVILVNAKPPLNGPERQVDEPSALPKTLPPGFVDLAPGLAEPGDILVTKSTWGAFFRTDLDSELKRRAVRTIVLGGVATHIGVEATARQAWELGYELVIARDVASSMGLEPHEATMRYVFPRIARVADSGALAFSPA